MEKNLESFYFNLSQSTNENFSENLDKFTSIVSSTIDEHAPLKKLSRHQLKLRSKPWLAKGILISIKNKRKMFKSHYISGTKREKSYFKKYVNALTKIKTISKKMHYEAKFEANKGDLRQVWNTISSVLPSNRKPPPSLLLYFIFLSNSPLQTASLLKTAPQLKLFLSSNKAIVKSHLTIDPSQS